MKNVFILSDDESDLSTIGEQLTKLKKTWQSSNKTKSAWLSMPEAEMTIFKVGKNIEDDLGIIKTLRINSPYHPIVTIDSEPAKVSNQIAQISNAIIRAPYPQEVLERVILRYLEPNGKLPSRIFTRYPAEYHVTWSHAHDKKKRESQTTNVSRAGAFIKENHLCPKRGDIVDFVIMGTKSKIVVGSSIVRWIATKGSGAVNPGFGVEFLSLRFSAEDLDKQLGILK
jgi:hypothetical protein